MADATERERAIAELVAQGLTNVEIAKRLGLALKTVEWNLTRMYRRFGLRSRAHLAAHVAQNPWAERPIVKNDTKGDTHRSRKLRGGRG